MERKALSLYELQSLVKNVVETTLNRGYWVEAELAQVQENGGHCYLELVEKREGSNTPVAKARAVIWRNTWARLKPYFERTTGQRLRAGMKVLIEVRASYHQAYGFSWVTDNIDPTYTMGDMARRRQEIIKKLKEEGVFDLNKELALTPFCQRIAVIGGEGTAGYGDFRRQLLDNAYGLRFDITLFPAIMQGEQVEQSIIAALNAINERIDDFDAVVIIRGGGAVSDLSGFDTLELAENVANFPLPIITGIGHERDDTVIDLIAHTRVKTPTAAAEFLIQQLLDVLAFIDGAQQRIVKITNDRLELEHLRLSRLSTAIPHLFSVVKTKEEARLDGILESLKSLISTALVKRRHLLEMCEVRIKPAALQMIERNNNRLTMLTQRANALDPALQLKRGYSITLKDGRAVKDAAALLPGDKIETRLSNGKIISTVTEK